MIAPRHDERGAVLVLMSILLVLLLGITALAVDLGIGRAHKREVQSGTDAGALGGAQELIPDPVASLTDAEAQARTLQDQNVSDFDDHGWTECTDTSPLPNTNSTPDCISFDTSFTRIRVFSPTQEINTLFGRIWNRETLRTRAVAEARIAPVGFATVLPFGFGVDFQLPEGCLRTAGGVTLPPPCDRQSTGDFGYLDIRQYGNEILGTDRLGCGSNQATSERLINNVAMGIDHYVSLFTGTNAYDRTCSPFPNTLESQTGVTPRRLTDALFKIDPGDPSIADEDGARLRRGEFGDRVTAFGASGIDNTPLYRFITPGPLNDAPRSCWRDNFENVLVNFPRPEQAQEMHKHLQKCFFEYRCGVQDLDPALFGDGSCAGPRGNPPTPLPVSECGGDQVCTGVVFGANTDPFGDEGDIDMYDIQLTPRFAYVPQFDQVAVDQVIDLTIDRFRAVYLYSTYINCNQACEAFDPGPWNNGPFGRRQDDAQFFTSFVFERTMLPGTLGDGPTTPGETVSIELVK